MSVSSSTGMRKKSLTQDKQTRQNAQTSARQVAKDKLEDGKKNLANPVIKKNSVKPVAKPADRARSTTTKPMLVPKSHQEFTTSSTGSKPKLKKPGSDPEKRGVSTIYMSKPTPRAQTTSTKASTMSNERTSTNSRKRLPSRERRRSRTLSPSEVKVLHKKSMNSVNKFEKNHLPCDYEYEDDFEDYESDFQECTDTETSEVSDELQDSDEFVEMEPIELKSKKALNKPLEIARESIHDVYEEQRLDSGHYELDEARRRAARIDLMSGNKLNRIPVQVMERPIGFNDEKVSEIKSLPSSADEGFEDGRSGDFAKSPPLLAALEMPNIAFTKRLMEKPKKRLTRGQKLLQMIKLDIVEWSIFESTPIAYEEFITIHGKINTRQIATQTNEDNLNVEIQTDEIKFKNMWTQFPVNCRSNVSTDHDVDEFNKELAGVGCEGDAFQHKRAEYDILQLNEFLGNAGKIMLALLEEKCTIRVNSEDDASIDEMPFSEAAVKLAVSTVAFLSGRPVTMIRYSDISNKILLTIHAPADEEIETAVNEDFYMTDCCIGCQWNIQEPLRPTKLFYSASNITASCIHPTNYNIVFGGLEDGSVSLWDLEEDEIYHPKFVDKDNEAEWVIRTPTFSTIGYFEEDEKFSKIISLKVLSKIESDGNEKFEKFMPIQICSLDEDGNCIIWSCLRNLQTGNSAAIQQLGQSWWGKIRLVKSHQISLACDQRKENVTEANNSMSTFRDLSVDTIDSNNLYIATNTNRILHATRTGKKLKPSAYDGNSLDLSGTTCIESCPFGQPYFLVGCTDGSLRLYSSMIEKPILQLKNLNSTAAIRIIQWSRSKPFTIYVLDDQSIIHIWDLSRSDIFPIHSISTKRHAHIGSIQLSPCRSDYHMTNQYLALGLDNGTVEIHKFNREFHYSDSADSTADLNTFLYYVAVY